MADEYRLAQAEQKIAQLEQELKELKDSVREVVAAALLEVTYYAHEHGRDGIDVANRLPQDYQTSLADFINPLPPEPALTLTALGPDFGGPIPVMGAIKLRGTRK